MGSRNLNHGQETGRGERSRNERVSRQKNSEGAIAPDLDGVIHERIRLGIVSALAVNESLSFTDLRRTLDTTDGNLSVHARRLEEAGYVECKKYFEGRVPRTEFRLTSRGRKALEQYLSEMEAIIEATRKRL